MTVFVTTHYMDEAEYCDRWRLIYRGELIALGTPEALKTELMQEDVLEVLCDRAGNGDGRDGRAPGGQGGGPVRHAACTWSATTAEEAMAESAGCWPSAGTGSDRIEKIVPSLEDVFVSLIEARDRAEQPQAEVAPMKPRRVWAVARKEFLHVLRDSAQPGHGDRHSR